MAKFTLSTSFQFPVFKVTELVTYSEVKKPSGVAYMLLVLIRDSTNRREYLSDVLDRLGVPKNLNDIFKEELQNLIDQGILQTSLSHYANFENATINEFSFTEKGKKVFNDEYISTGNEKNKKIELFYDIALNTFNLTLPLESEARQLKDSYLKPEFFKNFNVSKSPEAFINQNKGKNIGIKKEEVITKVEELDSTENWVIKEEIDILIDGDNAVFKFDNGIYQKFFEQYYQAGFISEAFTLKRKYQFSGAYSDHLQLTDYNDLDISGILIPKDVDSLLKQRAKLLVTKGSYNSDDFCIKSPSGLKRGVEFIQMDAHGLSYAYVPGNFTFKNAILGNIQIPLVLKIKISQKDIQEAIKPYLDTLKIYSLENFQTLVKITEIDKAYEEAFEIIEGYIAPDNSQNISMLHEMKTYVLSSAKITEKHKALTEKTYKSYLHDVTEQNLETYLKITNWIPKYLGLSSKEVLTLIFSALHTPNNIIETYDVLAEANFDEQLLLAYINPVEQCLKERKGRSASLIALLDFNTALSNLKELTHINSLENKIIDEDNINKSEFKKVFAFAKDILKKISFFRSQNKDLFNEYDSFMVIFEHINDYINEFENALSNPNNITPNLIEKKITSGDYQYIFVNISAKLEFILKSQYGYHGKLVDMLAEAKNNTQISKSVIDDLTEFREIRNTYVHPEIRKNNFHTNDLRRWSKEVFELDKENVKNEPPSNN